jgi:hypothetical protein
MPRIFFIRFQSWEIFMDQTVGPTFPVLPPDAATVAVRVKTSGTWNAWDVHGANAGDNFATYSTTTGGHITNGTQDGGGSGKGAPHPTASGFQAIEIATQGLAPGQHWYLYYDDSTLSGYPTKTGSTLVSGVGNATVEVPTSNLDATFTDYLFYVDPKPTGGSAPTVQNLVDALIYKPGAPAVLLDADALLADAEAKDGLKNSASSVLLQPEFSSHAISSCKG